MKEDCLTKKPKVNMTNGNGIVDDITDDNKYRSCKISAGITFSVCVLRAESHKAKV